MFNSEVLQQCRETDLFSLLLRVEPERWLREGRNYIRNKEHKSCIVTSGKGWVWNAQGKKGRNALDFLILFYGFSFREAVKCVICKDVFKEIDENKDIVTKAMRSETELFNSVLKNHQNKMNEKLKSWYKEIAEVIRLLIKTENRSSALIWINTVMAGVIVVFSIWIKIRG